MRRLVESWIAAERGYHGLTQAQAVKRLSEVLGARITHSRLSEWRRGVYCPSQVVVSEMLYRSLPWILREAGMAPSKEQQRAIDELLWVHDGETVCLL